MSKLKTPIVFETAFESYTIDELIGEGGAGRVYAGRSGDGTPVAVKTLPADKVSGDKRHRFKNEIAFLARNRHPNIVGVLDHGVAYFSQRGDPFYVMRRYSCSLRELMRNGIAPEVAFTYFSQILDGIDAAHLLGAVHRDIKPENVLYDKASNTLAVADFGIASFTDDILVTLVETTPAQRLANFQYAAPEQRSAGKLISATADVYALGLILNEMFTGVVPLGTDYRTITQVSEQYGFLDGIIATMLRQNPEERPPSITELKNLIRRHQNDAVSLQRLSKIDGAVIKSSEIDEPLALEPPKLVDADWNGGLLTLILDRPVNPHWVQALYSMGSYTSLMGKPPQLFTFQANKTTINAAEHEVQGIIDNFKTWLPIASRTLKHMIEDVNRKNENQERERLRREKEAEEQRRRIVQRIRI